MPIARASVDNAPDVRQEAHVQHAVGLIEHEKLNVVEFAIALFDEIEQSTGRGHDDVDALAQVFALKTVAHAAEYDDHAKVRESRKVAYGRFNLSRQFAGRFKDEKPRLGAV